jgi:hypothetical protein
MMNEDHMAIFDEQYRVVGIDSQRLVIRGVRSGEVLVINADPEVPLVPEDYPLGKLIALSDPSAATAN